MTFSIGKRHGLKPQQSCARVSDWPISIHNWVYIFPSAEFSIYVLTFCNLKTVSQKAQQYVLNSSSKQARLCLSPKPAQFAWNYSCFQRQDCFECLVTKSSFVLFGCLLKEIKKRK